ncbi:MAG: hypothetical protein LBP55_01840 [Candidatus Adiutrix sp.]|jgi:hypothetical protein|nr:hypothetical protein [Candidatus Adiutrix sp.]
MAGKYASVLIEVGGIQSFIFATGKLKEMIGASQAMVALHDDFLPEIRRELNLHEVDEPAEGRDWIVIRQNAAGALRLLLADEAKGKEFLTAFSSRALAQWPGLPLNGVLAQTDLDRESLDGCRKELSDKLALQRASEPVAAGLKLLPFVEMANLDGLPAAGRDKRAYISWPSQVRRDQGLLEAADRRLKENYDGHLKSILPSNTTIKWCDDFAEMLKDREQPRLGLIHIDGNDLGHFFTQALEAGGQNNPARMKELSREIDQANQEAFQAALIKVVGEDLIQPETSWTEYRVPLRPLLRGGDDLTVLVRADLALGFISAFVEKYEERMKEHGLSLGVGLLIMPPSYPFVKAWHLVEELCSSAKRLTLKDNPRPSSLDYLVLTGDVEADLGEHRRRTATADDGSSRLTAKPFKLTKGFLADFLKQAAEVINELPRSHTRGALNDCRVGRHQADVAWRKLRDNLRAGLGGRHDQRRMSLERFDEIFEDGFFQKNGATALADYLELADYISVGKEGHHADRA